MTKKHNNNKKRYKSNEEKPVIKLKLDDESMDEIEHIAQQLNTDTAGVIHKAFYLFRLAQGRRVVLKQKDNKKKLEIKDFEKTDKLID